MATSLRATLMLAFLVATVHAQTTSGTCPAGQYSNTDGGCDACPTLPNCAVTICSTFYDATCQQCASGRTGVLCTDCAPGLYKAADDSCVSCALPGGTCADGVLTCSGPSDARCTCGDGRYLSNTGNGLYCAPCTPISHCLQVRCNGPGASVCDNCVTGYVGPRCDSCTAGNYAIQSPGEDHVECRACPAIPRCQATACSSPTDGYCVLCEKGFSGSDCSSCDQGFYRNGDGECVKCPSVPQCRVDAVCTSATDASCPMCNPGYGGKKCDSCLDSFYMKSDKTCAKCPKLPKCPNSVRCTSPKDATCGGCPVPDAPSNGSVKGSYDAGDKITYSCNAGYTLDGVATRTCLDGQWTGTRPRCTKNSSKR